MGRETCRKHAENDVFTGGTFAGNRCPVGSEPARPCARKVHNMSGSIRSVALAAVLLAAAPSLARGDEVKVGVLHSLSGTMSISEITVKNATLLAIDEINAAGGVLGKKLAAVVED